MAQRGHGKATFLDINDGSGKIQVIVKQDKIGESGYKFFMDVFDIADFVEIKGILFTTERGEKTIEAEDYKMLAKALLPLPEKFHGLQDVEEKLRKRYFSDLGIFDPGEIDKVGKARRISHCYSCKKALDSNFQRACMGCKWMICSRCGACGCGYST